QSIACVTGREAWGFLKEVGSLSFPTDPGQTDFIANAMTFLNFSNTEVGQIRPLVRVHKPGGTAGQDSTTIVADIEDAIATIADSFVDAAIAKHWLTIGVPLVNLKQFPASDPTKACYQALVGNLCGVVTIRSITALEGGQLLDILPCASHRILQDLGLPSSTNIPLGLGMRVDMDFSVECGSEIWRAK
ncbi:MAG TPA: hypothetical protein VGF99_11145, partial [Myxococcota bacterium]